MGKDDCNNQEVYYHGFYGKMTTKLLNKIHKSIKNIINDGLLPSLELIMKYTGCNKKEIESQILTDFEYKYDYMRNTSVELWIEIQTVLCLYNKYDIYHHRWENLKECVFPLDRLLGILNNILNVSDLDKKIHRKIVQFKEEINTYITKKEEQDWRDAYKIKSVSKIRILYTEQASNEKVSLSKIIIPKRLVDSNLLTVSFIYKFLKTNNKYRGVNLETTRDVPNTRLEKLLNLDEDGVVRKGCIVSGEIERSKSDIVIGIVRDKEECEYNDEERLQSIFGKKIVADISLRVAPLIKGEIIKVDKKFKNGYLEEAMVYLEEKFPLVLGDILEDDNNNRAIITKILSEDEEKEMGLPLDELYIISDNKNFYGEIKRDINNSAKYQLEVCGIGKYDALGFYCRDMKYINAQRLNINEVGNIVRSGFFNKLKTLFMMNRDESCRNDIIEKLDKCQDLIALRGSNEVIGKITNLVSCLGFDIYLMKGGEKINLKQFLEEELNCSIYESIPEKPKRFTPDPTFEDEIDFSANAFAKELEEDDEIIFDNIFNDESGEIDFGVFDDEVLADDTFDSLEADDILGDDDFGDLN